jgi:hypothetical protein
MIFISLTYLTVVTPISFRTMTLISIKKVYTKSTMLTRIAFTFILCNSRLGDFVDRIYPNDFEIKDTTNTSRTAPHLKIHLEIVFQWFLKFRLMYIHK